MLKKMKYKEFLPHIIALVFVAIIPKIIFNESDMRINFWNHKYYFHLIIFIFVFYINYLFIVPKFYLKNKRIKFTVSILILVISTVMVSQKISVKLMRQKFSKKSEITKREVFEKERQKPENSLIHPKLVDDVLYLIMVIGFSTGMGILQRVRKDEFNRKDLEKNHAETELAFLKNQISPHFFFNSLNNIYALIAIDGEKAQQAVEKLSGLMRYLIYESDVKTVKLQKEFEFTKNYIELMKQRLSKKVKLSVDIQEEIPDIDIAPLIFIHFIENAFKHGISYREESFIEIELKVLQEQIFFKCRNSVPHIVTNDGEKGGLGILNIKKRLELLYGEKANLILKTDENSYIVELTLPTGHKS